VKVSPWETGGDVINTIDHGEYLTAIHEQVFQGLLGEKKEGLVAGRLATGRKPTGPH